MPTKKLMLRTTQEVYTAIEQLAVEAELVHSDTDAARYAETARVLLIGQLLHRESITLRLAVAVLSNATLILSGAFARLIYSLQDDLQAAAEKATRSPQGALARTRIQSGTQLERGTTPKAPIIHLTFDDWLGRTLDILAADTSVDVVREAGFRKTTAYVVTSLLRLATERRDAPTLVRGYAEAVKRVRTSLETAVATERDTICAYLRR